jgi:hypothetical protein
VRVEFQAFHVIVFATLAKAMDWASEIARQLALPSGRWLAADCSMTCESSAFRKKRRPIKLLALGAELLLDSARKKSQVEKKNRSNCEMMGRGGESMTTAGKYHNA